MAKARGTSGRGSAHGTPSSLTTLLAPTQLPLQPLAFEPDPTLMALAIAERQELLDRLDPPGDRRVYRPDKRSAPPHAFIRSATRLYIPSAKSLLSVPSFKRPNLVTLCLRRKARREVLHALDLTRKGGRGGARRRRNVWSNVKC